MKNYHSAKVGLLSEAAGEMHELLFGGITLQQYLPDDPAADANGLVTDQALPNANQITNAPHVLATRQGFPRRAARYSRCS